MVSFVAFIAISVCCCFYATEAQTIAMDRVWDYELNLPTSDDLCGVRVNLFAWWNPADAPESSGNYTIDLEFKHPNFKETINGVMEIQHDVHDRKNTTKEINICLSRCLTLLTLPSYVSLTLPSSPLPSSPSFSSLFTIHAASDNIQPKNEINLQITSERISTRSYVVFCSDRKTLDSFSASDDPVKESEQHPVGTILLVFVVVAVVSVLMMGRNSLGINYKENFKGSSSALAQSPSSTTAAGEGALYGYMLPIQFEDTDYKEQLLQYFKNLSILLKQDLLKQDPSINFDFYDFYSEKQAFQVSDVFGAPGHMPVHSGVVLTMVISNPDLHLNIHIDLAPTTQLYNLVRFKMTKGPVKGTYRGDVHSTLPELIENIKLTMNEMGNKYTPLDKNCITFKDVLLEKLKPVKTHSE